MRWSIRAQVVALVGLVLLAAMGVYLALAIRIVSADKEASVYDVNALVAGTVAEQIGRTVQGIADKLRYFGQEYETTPGEAERRARSLFAADEAVLSLEVFRRVEGGFERSFLFVDQQRLAALNLTADDLTEARKRSPAPLDAVQQAGVVLQNASLAPDLALMRLSVATADGRAVVIADLRPEWLLATVATSQVYRVFLVDQLGQVLAHPDASRVINHEDLSRLEVVKNALSGKVSRGAGEYTADGQDRLAAWARVEQGGGAVVVEVPRDEVFKATRELSRRSLLFAIGVVGIALALSVAMGRRVTRPLIKLQKQMAVVSKGEYGVKVDVDGPAEIQDVGAAFNDMSSELVRRADEIARTHGQLVQSEKLSAVGELAASVAHEVKNPMVGIVGFSQLGLESEDTQEMREYFKLIEQDALRANNILQNLLEFSRPPEMELELLAVNDVVNGSLQLCRHQLQMQGVKVDTAFADGLPAIKGNSNQLRQVLLNLLLNAGQAMESSAKKEIHVRTLPGENGSVEIHVADTGPGIPEEVKGQLFKPFFTTKRRGKGTGLGLSVSRSIIEGHRGSIRVDSAPGQGATFVIRIPKATPTGEVRSG
ncbi:MAG: ATP-binding protein [Myxococcota bacterium]